MISRRPAAMAGRAVPGHWEGDLRIGWNRSARGARVQSASRLTMLVHLPRENGDGRVPREKNAPSSAGYLAVIRAPFPVRHAYATGKRRSAIAAARVGDVRLKALIEGECKVLSVLGKGQKLSEFEWAPAARELRRDYLVSRRESDNMTPRPRSADRRASGDGMRRSDTAQTRTRRGLRSRTGYRGRLCAGRRARRVALEGCLRRSRRVYRAHQPHRRQASARGDAPGDAPHLCHVNSRTPG